MRTLLLIASLTTLACAGTGVALAPGLAPTAASSDACAGVNECADYVLDQANDLAVRALDDTNRLAGSALESTNCTLVSLIGTFRPCPEAELDAGEAQVYVLGSGQAWREANGCRGLQTEPTPSCSSPDAQVA